MGRNWEIWMNAFQVLRGDGYFIFPDKNWIMCGILFLLEKKEKC